MELKIRMMTAEDKGHIMRMLYEIPEFLPMEVLVAEEVIDAFLKDPETSGYHTYVAEIGPNVTGYICFGPVPLTEGSWDIYWVATDPKQQGRGIGRALTEFAEEKIKQDEGRLVFIETSSKAEYEKTRRFYCSRGYELISRIPDFYTVGDDKIILQKRFK